MFPLRNATTIYRAQRVSEVHEGREVFTYSEPQAVRGSLVMLMSDVSMELFGERSTESYRFYPLHFQPTLEKTDRVWVTAEPPEYDIMATDATHTVNSVITINGVTSVLLKQV